MGPVEEKAEVQIILQLDVSDDRTKIGRHLLLRNWKGVVEFRNKVIKTRVSQREIEQSIQAKPQ